MNKKNSNTFDLDDLDKKIQLLISQKKGNEIESFSSYFEIELLCAIKNYVLNNGLTDLQIDTVHIYWECQKPIDFDNLYGSARPYSDFQNKRYREILEKLELSFIEHEVLRKIQEDYPLNSISQPLTNKTFHR